MDMNELNLGSFRQKFWILLDLRDACVTLKSLLLAKHAEICNFLLQLVLGGQEECTLGVSTQDADIACKQYADISNENHQIVNGRRRNK